ncbi:hypothetical protein ASE71_29455 [Ensifer sp. Root954]|jgi:hypothetical protein|nr:hypothetical protein ASE71_29455 [Ensifer sp. Root954]RAS16344.1 hypothetical protein DEU52_102277 [Ensifer adhaerens]
MTVGLAQYSAIVKTLGERPGQLRRTHGGAGNLGLAASPIPRYNHTMINTALIAATYYVTSP